MRPVPCGIDHHRNRIGNADRVSELDQATIRESGGDDVLRNVTRHVSSRTIDLRRILSGESAAAVRRIAAVSIDDDLAAGQAGVALRAAGDKPAGRVDVILRVFVEQFGRDSVLDDLFFESQRAVVRW